MRFEPALPLLAVALSSCAVLPPSRSEMAGLVGSQGAGTRLAAGVHAASGPARVDLPFDVGAGYLYERGAGSDEGQHGNYIELDRIVWHRGAARALAGARVEVFWNDIGPTGTRRGASLRLGVERILGHVAAGDGGRNGSAAAYGVVAPGVFVEVGVREAASGDAAALALAGITLRLPLLFAASRPRFLR